jgi:hypothetical protein
MRIFRVLKVSISGLAILIAIDQRAATAQACPPNSHPVAVYIPGNLRTAHCWCNDGYINNDGVCVRTQQPTPPPGIQAQPSSSGTSMNPVR